MSHSVLTILTVLSAMGSIATRYRGPALVHYIFKPLTMIFILAIAFEGPTSAYRHWIIAGLCLSLVGDVFLMLPEDRAHRFITGLASFAVAHLCYIAAFSLSHPVTAPLWPLLPLGLISAGILIPIWSGVGALKGPVLVYTLVLVIMAFEAAGQFFAKPSLATTFSLAGAVLFMASDSLLAVNRFRRPFRSAQALLLSTYFLAQWLIASSTH